MIYVASSWRNARQPSVVKALRCAGHDVYDFRNPTPGSTGFASWSDIDPDWQAWTPAQFRAALQHPIAQEGLRRDVEALEAAEAVVLVMPCGRSAHIELGTAIGVPVPTAILLSDGKPELVYGMADKLCLDIEELLAWAETLR